jgi:hypothetical protein
MMRCLAWKEIREGCSVWLALALLGTGVVFLTPMFLELLGESDWQRQRTAVLIGLGVLAVTYGVVTGSMLLAGERESQTLVFLDALTARRDGLWGCKTLLGLVFALAQGVALTIPFVLWAPRAESSRGESMVWLLPALTLEATTWGLYSSSFGRNVLGSAGLGGLFYVLSWAVTFAAGALLRRNLPDSLAFRPLLDGLALLLSYRIFCRPDQERIQPIADRGLRSTDWKTYEPPAKTNPLQWKSSRTRGGWLALAWLAWRQGRSDLVTLVLATLLLGLVLAPVMVGSWALWTLLVGVVFGTGVWRPEQTEGSYRFLISQRLPPGRVWFMKTAFGLGAAGLVVASGMLGVLCQQPVLRAVGATEAARHVENLDLEVITLFGNAKVVAVVWLLHGFVVGQLFTFLCPKNLIAVMLSLPVSAYLVGMWVPSLVSGGLPVWQVFVIPVLLLAAGRLLLWAWAAERLATRRSALSLAACGMLAALWLIGCLTGRVLEVPDVGEPFDVEAFRASLPLLEKDEAGGLIRKAMDDLSTLRPEVEPAGKDTTRELFEGTWKNVLEKGVAVKQLGVVVDPLRVNERLPLGNVQACRKAAHLYRLYAVQLQQQGEYQAALDHLKVLFRLSLHLRNKTITPSFLLRLEMQDEALNGLEEWARGACDDSGLMRDALKALQTLESEQPPVYDVLKAHYLGTHRKLLDYYSNLTTPKGLEAVSGTKYLKGSTFLLSQETPWEKARTERLINEQYADAFAGRPPDPLREQQQPWLKVTAPGDWAQTQLAARRGLCRVRAAQLQLALLRYERQQKEPARALADLVPKYLDVLPADPWTGQDFHYRVSRGETIPVAATGAGTVLEVAPKQGVVWSTGPDGEANGGRVQGLNRGYPEEEKGLDWIFLVPRAR